MRGNKFKKSHIHILESETLSRESRITESAQEIVDSIPYNCGQQTYFNICQHFNTIDVEVCFTRVVDFTWSASDCEELVGEVNYTTEYVTDLFSFVELEWTIL